ncbi:MAG: hypothetical protein ACO24T_05880 [Hylemonella sp.]|jgi:hypothetical protein
MVIKITNILEIFVTIWFMKKIEAISLLGGSVGTAAAAIGVSSQAISRWPASLTQKMIDRVEAALYRQCKRCNGVNKNCKSGDDAGT